MSIEINGNQIIFERIFNAKRENVFKAYTDKTLFEQWFHPEGAETEVYQFNPVKGGKSHFAIKTPNQTSYTLTEYLNVQSPSYIEYLDYFATENGEKDTRFPGMKIYLNFEAIDAQHTKVSSTSVFPTNEAAQQAINMGVEDGMNSTLDQLENLLNK